MSRIYHLADPELWAQAAPSGRYTQSSRDLTLAEQGFIHCSDPHQWPMVRDAIYGDVASDLLLLEIDPELLDTPLVREVGNPMTGEEFPHLYGPLNVSAVVRTHVLAAPHAAGGP